MTHNITNINISNHSTTPKESNNKRVVIKLSQTKQKLSKVHQGFIKA